MTRPRLQRFVRWALDNSLLMVSGAVVALAWANVDHASYVRVTDPLHFIVNDVAMVFFFGLAVKEIIEATAPGGALHSAHRAALPVLAAVGGMAGPVVFYASLVLAVGAGSLLGGWAIPTATDIAFSYLVARSLFGAGHPAVPFLLLLAIADDALGLIVLGMFYPSAPMRPAIFVALVAAASGVAWFLRRWKTTSFWPYLVLAAPLSWAGFYLGGLHPALALVPVLPFLPHAAHDTGILADPLPSEHDALTEFGRFWKTPVEGMLFAFTLVNAGVQVVAVGTATWIVLGALLLGKPLGIIAATWCAERIGFRRPDGVTWGAVLVLSVTAGIGFTVALFFATASFEPGRTLDQAKLGALLSVAAALPAFLLARALRIGRYSQPQRENQ